MGSTTTIFGEDERGLTLLADGRTLRDAIAADPEGFLGAAHVRRYGPDPALLVKLLDAGERLPVHCHPDRALRAAAPGAFHRQDRGVADRRGGRGVGPPGLSR